MEPQSKLKAVRAKIVAANPELTKWVTREIEGEANGEPATFISSHYETREIRLADALLWLRSEMNARMEKLGDETKKNKLKWVEVDRLRFAFSYLHDSFHSGERAWNLRSDSLDSQSPECIDFLFSLLV